MMGNPIGRSYFLAPSLTVGAAACKHDIAPKG
jgi:hypothetical protein